MHVGMKNTIDKSKLKTTVSTMKTPNCLKNVSEHISRKTLAMNVVTAPLTMDTPTAVTES